MSAGQATTPGGTQAPPSREGGGALGPVAVTQRLVVWDKDGNPVVKTQQVFTKTQINELQMAAAAMPYVDPNDELAVAIGLPPSEFYGMTNLEVMLVKQARYAAASGERDYVNDVLDRLQGKPKQSSESHVVTDTYESALARIGQTAAAKAKPVINVAADR